MVGGAEGFLYYCLFEFFHVAKIQLFFELYALHCFFLMQLLCSSCKEAASRVFCGIASALFGIYL